MFLWICRWLTLGEAFTTQVEFFCSWIVIVSKAFWSRNCSNQNQFHIVKSNSRIFISLRTNELVYFEFYHRSTRLRGMWFCALERFFFTGKHQLLSTTHTHTGSLVIHWDLLFWLTGASTASASTTRTWKFWKEQRRDTRKSNNLHEYMELVP